MEGEAGTDPRLKWTVPWRWVSRVEIDRKIGIAFANFYDALLESYLSPAADRSGQVEEALQKLPLPLRRLFRKALAAIQQEAGVNQALVEAHRGNEAVFLLGDQLKEYPGAAEKILPRAANETTFIQLAPGFYLLVMEEPLFQLFRDHDVILKGGAAYAQVELGRDRPKFMVIPPEELGNVTEGHELRHVLWSFLRQSGFVRRTTEEGTMAKGYESFRDEFMAYVLGDARLPNWVKYLVYEDDLELEKTGDELRLMSNLAIKFSRENKVDPRALARAAIVSRSFEQFTNEISRMTPFQQDLDTNGLKSLLKICDETMPGGERAVVVARRLVESKGLRASAQVRVEALTLSAMETRGCYGYLRKKVEETGEHLTGIFGQGSDFVVRQAIKNSLRKVWPEEVVDLVVEAPEDATAGLYVTAYASAMIRSISIRGIANRESWEFYRQLINANAENREAFASDSVYLASVAREQYRRGQGSHRPWANQEAIARGATYRGSLVGALGWARDFDEASRFAQQESESPAALGIVG